MYRQLVAGSRMVHPVTAGGGGGMCTGSWGNRAGGTLMHHQNPRRLKGGQCINFSVAYLSFGLRRACAKWVGMEGDGGRLVRPESTAGIKRKLWGQWLGDLGGGSRCTGSWWNRAGGTLTHHQTQRN